MAKTTLAKTAVPTEVAIAAGTLITYTAADVANGNQFPLTGSEIVIAQNTDAAKRFLESASFPKASIEKTPEGHEVQIRDLRYAVSGETRNEVVAVIRTDSNGRVIQDELRWERDFRRR